MEGTSMPNWLMKRAELTPERIAINFDNHSYTFKEVYEHSLGYARGFYEKGIRKGDKIGVLQGNTLEMVLTIHASMLIGAEMVLFNIRLAPNELLWQLKDSGVNIVIADREHLSLLEEYEREKVYCVQDMEAAAIDIEEGKLVVREIDLNEPATYMYTSGTTGRPKAVIQTYGNHWWSAAGSMLNLGLHEKDVWLCTVPLFHISGLSILMRSVIYGMKVVLHSRFDERQVNRSIREQNVTIASVVTAMLNRLMTDLKGGIYPPAFRCMLLGGGPAPLSILESCKNKGIPVYQTYGMTETSSQIATLSPEYSLSKLGSAGKALFPCQLKIMNGQNEANVNEVGEIVVKGPNVTGGYAGNEEANVQSFLEGGWFRTGDMGRLDADGFLYVVDRRSDLIISGGENIYPAELEAAICRHPAVLEAGVTGLPDEKWGMVPIAFVVLKDSCPVEELQEHCAKNLAGYKRPQEMHIVEELPKNASNKLIRRKLLEMRGRSGEKNAGL